MTTGSFEFGDLTSCSEMIDGRSDVIYIWPVSATEQHGPHLPNGTDALILEGLRRLVDERLEAEPSVVWLPSLVFGNSEEHVGFPGTLSISPKTMMSVIDDVCRSLRAGGCSNLIFLNGHGGNVGVLSVMIREVRVRHGIYTYLIRPMALLGKPSHDGLDLHAGELETSVVLALRPDLVQLHATHGPNLTPLGSGASVGVPGSMGWVTSDLSRDGVIGNVSNASSQVGTALVDNMVDFIVHEIEAFWHLVNLAREESESNLAQADDGGEDAT